MRRSAAAPKVWSKQELKVDRDKSEEIFRGSRTGGGREAYHKAFAEAHLAAADALTKTCNLTKVTGEVMARDNQLWQVLRFFCGPHISQEDFWTLVGRKFSRLPAEVAHTAASIITQLVDPCRVPWLAAGRPPSPAEKKAALIATATLLAHEHLRTSQRGEAAKSQEAEVIAHLLAASLASLPDEQRTPIRVVDDLPSGSFCREQKILAAKCDVPVRLRDGRLLAIECKVSNGPKNSWKRLLREVGGKSDAWRAEFGSNVIVMAVIAGVFDLRCLERAQEEHHIAIVWQHDLGILDKFLADCCRK